MVDVESVRATYLNGGEVVVLQALMVLQDRVFPLQALVFATWAVVVLQYMVLNGTVQMVL